MVYFMFEEGIVATILLNHSGFVMMCFVHCCCHLKCTLSFPKRAVYSLWVALNHFLCIVSSVYSQKKWCLYISSLSLCWLPPWTERECTAANRWDHSHVWTFPLPLLVILLKDLCGPSPNRVPLPQWWDDFEIISLLANVKLPVSMRPNLLIFAFVCEECALIYPGDHFM